MILRLIEEGIAAGIGTIAFALMFHVPKQYYLCGGVAGAAGWLVYRALELNVNSLMGPVFAGAFTVVFLSRIFAVRKKMPRDDVSDPGNFRWCQEWASTRNTAQALVGSDWGSGGLQGTDLHQVCCCHRGRHPSRALKFPSAGSLFSGHKVQVTVNFPDFPEK